LRELRPVVDAFFDHVMVMTQDNGLRRNRLNLLWALLSMLSSLAAFSELQI
jgi:glycyl-tRNA synthetase beta chain